MIIFDTSVQPVKFHLVFLLPHNPPEAFPIKHLLVKEDIDSEGMEVIGEVKDSIYLSLKDIYRQMDLLPPGKEKPYKKVLDEYVQRRGETYEDFRPVLNEHLERFPRIKKHLIKYGL